MSRCNGNQLVYAASKSGTLSKQRRPSRIPHSRRTPEKSDFRGRDACQHARAPNDPRHDGPIVKAVGPASDGTEAPIVKATTTAKANILDMAGTLYRLPLGLI